MHRLKLAIELADASFSGWDIVVQFRLESFRGSPLYTAGSGSEFVEISGMAEVAPNLPPN